MKKLLLSLLLVNSLHTFAQQAYTEDCSTLLLGNIGTNLTGTAAGQGGWFTSVPAAASPAGQNSDFQIVNGGPVNGNCIQINGTSSSVTSGQTRAMFQGFSNSWTNRTSGNDVVQLEYDFYTGDVSTSKNTYRNYIFSADGTVAMAGFYFVPETMEIRGWAQYDNAGTVGYYTFGLGSTANPTVLLNANTWYRIGVSFDYNTGDIAWKESTGLFYGGVTGSNAGQDINLVQFQISNADSNASAAQVRIDNISLSYHPQEELLSTNEVLSRVATFSVYPNPVKDVVTVTNTESIAVNGITITDLNGRTIKTVNYNNISDNIQVNVSDLSSGVYMMNIKSDKGSVTKKIVKN